MALARHDRGTNKHLQRDQSPRRAPGPSFPAAWFGVDVPAIDRQARGLGEHRPWRSPTIPWVCQSFCGLPGTDGSPYAFRGVAPSPAT